MFCFNTKLCNRKGEKKILCRKIYQGKKQVTLLVQTKSYNFEILHRKAKNKDNQVDF